VVPMAVPGRGGEGWADAARFPGTSTWRRSEAPMWRRTWRAHGGGGSEGVDAGGCVMGK
jgi:hypothetical protein